MDMRPLTDYAAQLAGMSASFGPRLERLANVVFSVNTAASPMIPMTGRTEASRPPSIAEQLERTGEQLARADKALGELERLISGVTEIAKVA